MHSVSSQENVAKKSALGTMMKYHIKPVLAVRVHVNYTHHTLFSQA